MSIATVDQSGSAFQRTQATKPAGTKSMRLYSPPIAALSTLLYFLLVGVVIYLGWKNRTESYLAAEEGLGYALGIIGGAMMLLLLLYPLRKRARFMRRLGPVKHWFRVHMILGVVGPSLVLFHSNFQLGSLNSNVALFCMLLVAVSGLVGRYVYAKIHYGLYGSKVTLESLQCITTRVKEKVAAVETAIPQLIARLEAFEEVVLAPPHGVIDSAVRVLSLGARTQWEYFALLHLVKRALKHEACCAKWTAKQKQQFYKAMRRHIATHLAAVRKVAEFSFYERLLALWHLLHYPLFLMMVLAAVVHVVAVHMY